MKDEPNYVMLTERQYDKIQNAMSKAISVLGDIAQMRTPGECYISEQEQKRIKKRRSDLHHARDVLTNQTKTVMTTYGPTNSVDPDKEDTPDRGYRLTDPAEAATVIAALRYYQRQGMGEPMNRPMWLHDIAEAHGEQVSLDDSGIAKLVGNIIKSAVGFDETPEQRNKLFWISWYMPKGFEFDEDQFEYWVTGLRMRDSADIICAIVFARNEEEAKQIVEGSFHEVPFNPIEWRFCEEKPSDWGPGDRFPRNT